MIRLFTMLALTLLAGGIATAALAVPVPLSEQELTDKSDLVALVRVLSVTCTTVTKDEQTGEDLPSYLAKLEVKEVKKGDVKPGESVLVTWRAVPKSIVGPWAVYYYPGEVVWTHLTKRSNGATYASTWLNAKSEIVTSPETKELPTQPGETMTPPEERKPQTPLSIQAAADEALIPSSQSLNRRVPAALAAGAKRAVSARILARSTLELASSSACPISQRSRSLWGSSTWNCSASTLGP